MGGGGAELGEPGAKRSAAQAADADAAAAEAAAAAGDRTNRFAQEPRVPRDVRRGT